MGTDLAGLGQHLIAAGTRVNLGRLLLHEQSMSSRLAELEQQSATLA